MRKPWFVLAVISAGCHGGHGPSPLPAAPPARAAALPPTAAAPTPGATTPVLASLSADLDGDGHPETVTLTALSPELSGPVTGENGCASKSSADGRCHATLAVGAAQADIIINWVYPRPPSPNSLALDTIDIDALDGRREIVVRQRAVEDEDPPWRFVVARWDGTSLTATPLWGGGGYNDGELRARGDGHLDAVWDECPDQITVTYLLAGQGLQETGRNTVRTRKPDQCAACPAVYQLGGAEPVRAGEILRHLSSPALDGAQRLLLGLPWQGAARHLVLRIQEEKPETSYLDELHVEVDGRKIAPADCPGAAYCAADGRPLVLRRGDHVDVAFPLDQLTPGSRIELWASGHYLPDR